MRKRNFRFLLLTVRRELGDSAADVISGEERAHFAERTLHAGSRRPLDEQRVQKRADNTNVLLFRCHHE
jgi:hypothetical protein